MMSTPSQPCAPVINKTFIYFLFFCIIYLIYSPAFTLDYLMNDEIYHTGQTFDPAEQAKYYFFKSGRGLFGLLFSWVYNFVGSDLLRINLVRFVHVGAIAIFGILLIKIIGAKTGTVFAFFAVLFFYSQISMQGIMGYGLQTISHLLPAVLFSLLAMYLHFYVFKETGWQKWVGYLAVIIAFLASMQARQTDAFICMIPISFLLLVDDDKINKRIISFFILATISFILSFLIYKVGLEWIDQLEQDRYFRSEEGLDTIGSQPLAVLLKAINPLSYWRVFKLWTYPFPFHITMPLVDAAERVLSLTVIAFSAVLVGAGVLTEARGKDRPARVRTARKWLLFLVCAGFGAIWLAADSPVKIVEHRPHIVLTLVGILIMGGAYALKVTAAGYAIGRSPIAKALGVVLVTYIAFGAQTGFLRNIVDNRADEIDFIRTELAAKPLSDYSRIVVVTPKTNFCLTEPCGPYHGKVATSWLKLFALIEQRYRYVLATLGAPPESKEIVFVDSKPQPNEDEVIVDWSKYLDARERYQDHLSR